MSGLSLKKLLKGRSLRILVFSAVSLGLVLLYLLATETPQTSDVFDELPMLLGAGILLIVLLIILVGAQLNYLRRRLKAKVFGSKLTARLVLVFTLVAIVPGAVMYGISVKFLAGSMQSWFDVRVDNALEGGLNLGRANLENGLRELKQKAESMAVSLSLETPASRLATLYNLREQAAIHEATLFSSGGEVLAHAAEDDELVPSAPSQTILRNVRVQQSYSVIEEDALARMVLKVILPVYTLDEELEVFLQVSQFVPENLARDAVLVQEAYRDYQELSLSRYGLQRLYNIALA
ncbi:MAG: PAS domain-containing sensor histidine kinase, partial [Betaproteobacteria bacterium]